MPFPDREAWQATVYRARVGYYQSDLVHIDARLFFASGSSAPVRVEHEGGAVAWVAGVLVAQCAQGHVLPLLQELWPYQSLFLNFLSLAIRRLLWPVFLHSSAYSVVFCFEASLFLVLG